MRKLQWHELDLEPTLTYINNNLKFGNTLSVQLLKLIDFKEGNFFSYFLPNVEEQNIYQFSHSIHSAVINTKEIVNLLVEYIQLKKLSCIFEDIVKDPKDPYLEEFYECGLLYNHEIYYFIDRNNLSNNLVLKCLNASSAIWHSLCILTNTSFNLEESNILTSEMINIACLNTHLVIIGAYDDEGYIFWKKNINHQ